MLLRRSSILNELGDELAEEMTDLFEISLVWFAVNKNFRKKIFKFLISWEILCFIHYSILENRTVWSLF